MDTRETVAFRIRQLCAARKITPNGLANLSAVPQEITLSEFFSTPEFDALEQEIK